MAGGRYTLQTGAQSEDAIRIVIETRAADKDNESEKAIETAEKYSPGGSGCCEKAESGETADTEKAETENKESKIQQMSQIRSLLKIK